MACADCYSGGIRTDRPDPTGTVTRMHGLDVYVAEPPADGQAPAPAARGIVVIIPDAFGWDFVNIRQMADNIARKGGFRVYAPDFMKGERSAVRCSRGAPDPSPPHGVATVSPIPSLTGASRQLGTPEHDRQHEGAQEERDLG